MVILSLSNNCDPIPGDVSCPNPKSWKSRKRYRTFLFFGPQNQQKREKKERKPKEFLEFVTKKCSFLHTKKAFSFNSAVVRGGGSETGISYMDEKRVCRLRWNTEATLVETAIQPKWFCVELADFSRLIVTHLFMPVAPIQEGGRFAAVGVSSCLIQEGGRFAAEVPNSLKETILII